MSLTRSFMKGMGLTDEQVSAIIEAHTETVEGLKEQRDNYKEKADKYEDVQKELNDLKSTGGEWQTKYEKEHSDFEAFKKDLATKDSKQKKENAYRNLLKELKIDDKCVDGIIKLADMSKIEFEEDGKVKEADKLKEAIKTEWSGFIVTETASGTTTPNPSGSSSGDEKDLGSLSMEEYIAARKKK